MKLWLDDIRPAPQGWEWAKTSAQANEILRWGRVEFLSLDHDLGCPVSSGSDVSRIIEYMANVAPSRLAMLRAVQLHSANPVGVKNMHEDLKSANRILEAAGLKPFQIFIIDAMQVYQDDYDLEAWVNGN